jgi:hypothetical protein
VNAGISALFLSLTHTLDSLSFVFVPALSNRFNPTHRHVKALESRSQLLDAALASADEANRRWEECRALVDQLRIENAALRAALSQAQMLGSGGSNGPPPGGSDENRPNAGRVADGTKNAEEPKE